MKSLLRVTVDNAADMSSEIRGHDSIHSSFDNRIASSKIIHFFSTFQDPSIFEEGWLQLLSRVILKRQTLFGVWVVFQSLSAYQEHINVEYNITETTMYLEFKNKYLYCPYILNLYKLLVPKLKTMIFKLQEA